MSERKLASVQTIVSIDPIAGADKIAKATILGWELVVAKSDNFKVGDKVVYLEVDSIVPDRPEFEFLRERKFRIKTIKLKGQVSQGICFPLSILPKGNYKEGDDVTDILGVRKHDPQAEFERKEADRLSNLHKTRMGKFLKRYAWYRRFTLKARGTRNPFPAFIRKTDEDRIQLFPDACERWKGIPFDVTEKLDGQSATYFVVHNPKKGLFRPKWIFGVCSRNFQLIKEDNSSYWTIAKQENLKENMLVWCKEWNTGLIIQGEIIGSKIQGNKYNRNGIEFYVFNMVEYDEGEKTVYNQRSQIIVCNQLSLKPVPYLCPDFILPSTIHATVDFSKGTSTLADIYREGIVVRNYDLNISFKIVNPDFLLKYGE